MGVALSLNAVRGLSNDLLRHEFANAFCLNRHCYNDDDRRLIVEQYKSRNDMPLPPTVVYRDDPTGLWVVAVASPTAETGYIVQSERPTEKEAWEDARNWE